MNALYAHAGLYRDFIPMQFHVDYWDYIGWKDPYAKPQYSKRQRQYATEWSSGQVYTPAFVKNGKEWRTIIARRPPEKSTEKVGVLQALKKAKGSYQVRFEPSLQKFKGPLILHWALLGHGLATSVTRGENSGKALKNNFTVLSHRQKPLTRKQERFQAEVKIAPTAIKAPEYALVFWLTTGHSQAAIQATGGCINEVI